MPNWTERLTEPFTQQTQKQRQAVEEASLILTSTEKKVKNWPTLKSIVGKKVVAPLEKWLLEMEKAWPQPPAHLKYLRNERLYIEWFTWGWGYYLGIYRVRFQTGILRVKIKWGQIKQAIIKRAQKIWAELKSSEFLLLLLVLLVTIVLTIGLTLLLVWITLWVI